MLETTDLFTNKNLDKNKHQEKLMATDFEAHVLKLGESVLKKNSKEKVSLFQKNWWYQKILEWSMKKESFKTQMFRFVDVLPYLTDNNDLIRHLEEYFKEGDQIPAFFQKGAGIGKLSPQLFAGALRKNITEMAKLFITGANPEEAIKKIEKNRKKNLGFTADLLGEATLSETEGQIYFDRYLELMESLSQKSKSWKENPLLDTDHLGKIPSVNVSVKLTSLTSKFRIANWDESIELGYSKLKPLFLKAKQDFLFLNLDMEQYEFKDLTLAVFQKLLMDPDLKDYPHFGIVIQAYLKDSLDDLKELVAIAEHRQVPFSIRLVKGAYWDFEVIHAQEKDWPIPVFTVKESTDANFEKCAQYLIDQSSLVKLALGSHNLRSICATLEYAKSKNIQPNQIEIQMLYGMADSFKAAFIEKGHRVREYDTIGELIPGMAYLVRRLLENTSNQSFLKSKFSDNIPVEILFKKPEFKPEIDFKSNTSFSNHAPLDFGLSKVRTQFQSSIHKHLQEIPYNVPVILNGAEIKTQESHEATNPSNTNQVLGKIHYASLEQANEAVEKAHAAFSDWSQTSASDRSRLVNKLADLMDQKRYELASLECLEVGKPWAEADGDITEAIDFCRYYAQDILTLDRGTNVGQTFGEKNFLFFEPRGVCSVIAPWNFPLAILAGMAVGALVTGNTVVLKPAEQSSLMAYEFYRMLLEAGFPAEVIQFIPGKGEVVGEALVNHPKTSLICFTGSKTVGLQIVTKASVVHPGQTHVKKCVIEMGGKNAMIIDSDADLDEAIHGVLYSAFGFQGQKCSACSRVFVHQEHFDTFVARLIDAAKSLYVGSTDRPETDVGPLIDQEAYTRVIKTLEMKKQSHELVYSESTPDSNKTQGWYVGPHIFKVDDPHSDLAKAEFFAPILDIYKVKDIDQALEWAQNTEYALTGGIYSRSPETIKKVKKEFKVGNLYINRSITGAMVFRHPFGGFKLSGLGSKTGGPEYLKQFMDPRVVTENTVRRGFSPELLLAQDSENLNA